MNDVKFESCPRPFHEEQGSGKELKPLRKNVRVGKATSVLFFLNDTFPDTAVHGRNQKDQNTVYVWLLYIVFRSYLLISCNFAIGTTML